MARNRWAKRYAQAVYEIATAGAPGSAVEKTLDRWAADLGKISEAVGDEDFRVFLNHAKVPFRKKTEVIDRTLKRVDPMARGMLSVMVSRGQAGIAPQVGAEFRSLLDRRRGIERVTVYSAIPLRKREQDRVRNYVEGMIESKVALDTQVDPSIIGGLVIRIGDKLLDGSARTKLENLREELEATPLAS